ncbi:conserved hypothetical protein [Mesorhizobium plurifarium]|uniref:DUF982 domain-containing protein n=1 Tax=Mesorhizobium plurifarium TaxID=69974 RepID=A0A090DUW9_MESPL|nr:conserved hypothetical protein [Mesorhizobium plurifarium]
MQDQRFETPSACRARQSGHTIYTVDRVAQAADILLNRWLASPGKKHTAARKACLNVLQGLGAVRHARKAFVEAAAEAGILVEHDPFG